MPEPIADMLKRVWRPPYGVTIYPADHDKHYKPWGFTLYRTCYNPSLDQQWKLLIDKISTSLWARLQPPVVDEAFLLSKFEHREEKPDDALKVWNLFKLDARSDPATLAGLTRDEVCQVYRDKVGGEPMGMMTSLDSDHQIFLLADEEVLGNPDLDTLKVVQASFDPFDGQDDDDPRRAYDWMTMHPESLVDLWIELENADAGLYDLIWEGVPGSFWEP
jgi:hypothetical protein